ncbi:MULTISPECIES: T9SS type A sorting domain-containing protein [Flavobacterium]|uniref:Secretion system C-terminal sorting domain-containing protein n=1 Tax=Flavobacterium hankyongi TaxID=1176532 RepID=A0ABP8ZQY0_9FLAO|nr:T9SS type A sorting domain-containing protein [Flavobacterium sp. N1846]
MKKILFIYCLFFSAISFGQEDFVFSGGEATGSGGTVSYSFGQVAFETVSGSNGELTQGVQQALEVYTLATTDFSYGLQAILYPNPAIYSVNLSLGSLNDFSQLSYELIDVSGKILQNGKITESQTEIDVSNLSSATYFFNLIDSGKRIKSFKLIKNN